MKKAIVLYKGGRLRYASEKKVKRILQSKSHYDSVYSILIPMLDHKTDIFIPIIPDSRWVFYKAKFATFTSIYSFGYECNDIEQVKTHRTEQETTSLFELVNLVHYIYKLKGYLSTIIASYSDVETFLNLILPSGIMLRLYDKSNRLLYDYAVGYEWSHDLEELMETGDIMAFEEKFLEPFTEIGTMFTYDAYSLWFSKRDCIRIDNDEWYGDHRIRPDYSYLNFLSRFYAFCLCEGAFLRTLIGAPSITMVWLNLSDADDTKNYCLSDPLPKLREDIYSLLNRGGYSEIDYYYDSYSIDISECDEFLYVIYFGRTILEYSKYILYVGIMDEHIDIATMDSMIILRPATAGPFIQDVSRFVLCREMPSEIEFCRLLDDVIQFANAL